MFISRWWVTTSIKKTSTLHNFSLSPKIMIDAPRDQKFGKCYYNRQNRSFSVATKENKKRDQPCVPTNNDTKLRPFSHKATKIYLCKIKTHSGYNVWIMAPI